MYKLKVLVVDDSLVYRRIISKAVEKTNIAVVDCTASSGITALERLEQRNIDVVLLDVFMPKMDGIETLREIKRKYSHIPVIMISSGGVDGAKITVEALRLGAMDFILKPTNGDMEKNMKIINRHLNLLFSQILLDKYIEKGKPAPQTILEESKGNIEIDKIIDTAPPSPPKKREPASRPTSLCGVDIVVMASSTGGPNAVEEVCKALGSDFSKPILLVQHMPPDFTRIFANFLAKRSRIQVKEAQEGDKIVAGQMLVAPGGYHMIVNSDFTISLIDDEPVNGVKPAADVLFKSVAKAYAGKRVLAVILTGMGSDGTEGLRALKNACHCYSITQSEESSVIYGMPRSVDEAGLSDESVDLKDIGRRITEISRGRC